MLNDGLVIEVEGLPSSRTAMLKCHLLTAPCGPRGNPLLILI